MPLNNTKRKGITPLNTQTTATTKHGALKVWKEETLCSDYIAVLLLYMCLIGQALRFWGEEHIILKIHVLSLSVLFCYQQMHIFGSECSSWVTNTRDIDGIKNGLLPLVWNIDFQNSWYPDWLPWISVIEYQTYEIHPYTFPDNMFPTISYTTSRCKRTGPFNFDWMHT